MCKDILKISLMSYKTVKFNLSDKATGNGAFSTVALWVLAAASTDVCYRHKTSHT